MPRCYPDLESIQQCIEIVSQNEGDLKYNGIYPDTEDQLPQARQELATYFRDVWGNHLQAVEIELGLSEEDPEAKGKLLEALTAAWTATKMDSHFGEEQELAEADGATIEIRVIHGKSAACFTERFLALHRDRIGDAIERMGNRIQRFASEGKFASIPVAEDKEGAQNDQRKSTTPA